MNRFFDNPVARVGIAFSAVLSTVSGLVSDFFMPIAPYGFVVAGISGFLVLLTLALFLLPISNSYLKRRLKSYWYLPTFLLLTIFTGLTLGFQFLSLSYDKGVIASTEVGSLLQNSLLNIESKLDSIDLTTKEIANNTAMLKRETSDNPRKELQNMGIEFTDKGLFQAIRSGDEVAVNLFIQAEKPIPSHTDETSSLVLAASSSAYSTLRMYFDSKLVGLDYFERKAPYFEVFGTPAFTRFDLILQNAIGIYYKDPKNLSKPLGFMLIDSLSVALASDNFKLARFLLDQGVSASKYCALVTETGCLIEINPIEIARDRGFKI